MDKAIADGGSKAPNAQRQVTTQEKIFKQRLQDMKLIATYETEYLGNMDLMRFCITLFRGNVFLDKISSEFTTKSEDYQGMAFQQANLRLDAIEKHKRHLPSTSATSMSKFDEKGSDDY